MQRAEFAKPSGNEIAEELAGAIQATLQVMAKSRAEGGRGDG